MTMRLFRELPSFRRTIPNMSVGKLVIEFAFTRNYMANGNGWRTLTFGVFRVKRLAKPGEYWFRSDHISGFRRQYSIWLPFYRET